MTKDSVILERRFVPAGTLIIKEGDEGNCAYLIQSGSVSIFTYNNGNRVNLAELGLGQIFGELALVFDEVRSASVEAKEDCNLIILTRDTLKQKLKRSDPTVQAIVEMMTKRIVSANNAMLRQEDDFNDLVDTARIVYQNILTTLPRKQQQQFQAAILPKLDDFLESVRTFQAEITTD